MSGPKALKYMAVQGVPGYDSVSEGGLPEVGQASTIIGKSGASNHEFKSFVSSKLPEHNRTHKKYPLSFSKVIVPTPSYGGEELYTQMGFFVQ